MSTLWIVILVCFSILDTAILVPWGLSRRQRKANKGPAEHPSKFSNH